MSMEESFNTIVIGGGQAGLATGYFLAQKGDRFTILDKNPRTGDVWRSRWDSLRLFTPCKYNSLPGKPFPGAAFYFPTKDEVAGYLKEYRAQFRLPVQHGVNVERLSRSEHGYRLSTTAGVLNAKNVIVATGPYQKPYIPAFASEIDPAIYQVHSSAYCNPQQIQAQNILVVGAGNSGAEIGLELARARKRVWVAGMDVGRIPADKVGKIFGGVPYWFLISRVLSVKTPIGRKMQAKVLHHGAPLINVSREDFAGAGIQTTPRVSGVQSGKPVVEGGNSLPAEAIIWATGFRPDFKWIDLPVFDEYGYPRHRRGVIQEAPGLYFVGLPFQTALSSALLGGVGEEASYIVRQMG